MLEPCGLAETMLGACQPDTFEPRLDTRNVCKTTTRKINAKSVKVLTQNTK